MRDDERAPISLGPASKSGVGVEIALPLLWLSQILVPACLLGYAFIESFNLPEASPLPQAQLDRAHAALIAFAIVILVIPAVGCVLAASTKHSVQAWVFGVIFVVALVVDGGLYALYHQGSKPTEPVPVVTQCIPRSGGHGCPGG